MFRLDPKKPNWEPLLEGKGTHPAQAVALEAAEKAKGETAMIQPVQSSYGFTVPEADPVIAADMAK